MNLRDTVSAVLDRTGRTDYTLIPEGDHLVLRHNDPRPNTSSLVDESSPEGQARDRWLSDSGIWKEALYEAREVVCEGTLPENRTVREASLAEQVRHVLTVEHDEMSPLVGMHMSDEHTAMVQPPSVTLSPTEGEGARMHREWTGKMLRRYASYVDSVPGWTSRVGTVWLMVRRADAPGGFPTEVGATIRR